MMVYWLIGFTGMTAFFAYLAFSQGRARFYVHEALLTSLVALIVCLSLFYPVYWRAYIPILLIQLILFISLKMFIDRQWPKRFSQETLPFLRNLTQAVVLTMALHALYLVVLLRLPGVALHWQLAVLTIGFIMYGLMIILRAPGALQGFVIILFMSGLVFFSSRFRPFESFTVKEDTNLITFSMRSTALGTAVDILPENYGFYQATLKDTHFYVVTGPNNIIAKEPLKLLVHDFTTDETIAVYTSTLFDQSAHKYLDLVSHGEALYLLSQTGLYQLDGANLMALVTVNPETAGIELADFYHALYIEDDTLFYHDQTARYIVHNDTLTLDPNPVMRYGDPSTFRYHFSYHGRRFDLHADTPSPNIYTLYDVDGPIRVRNYMTTLTGLYTGGAWYHLFQNERLLHAHDGLTPVHITHPEDGQGPLCLETHQAKSCVYIESFTFYHLTTHNGQLYDLSSPNRLLNLRESISLQVDHLQFDQRTLSTYPLNDLSRLYILGILCLFIPLKKASDLKGSTETH